MKKLIFTLMFIIASLTANARGGIPFLIQHGDDIINVATLPDNELFKLKATEDGPSFHADLGILHEQISIFWIPIINYGEEKYVLYSSKENGCAELDQDEMTLIKAMINQDLPDKPELPFWNAWGGKLVFLLLISIFIFITAKS